MKSETGIKELKNEIRQLQEELVQERKRFQNLADYFNCSLWEYDIREGIMEYSRRFDLEGDSKWKKIPNFRRWVKSHAVVHPEDMELFDAFCDGMEEGKESFEYDFRMMLLDRERFAWLRFAGNTLWDEEGRPYKAVGKLLDITEEKTEREHLKKKAMQDPLTALYNKTTTRALIAEQLSRPDVAARKWAYMIIDIDNFKGINDQFGHLCGDKMLTDFAGILKNCFRKQDIVGRIGGDEFLVFCHNVESEEEAAAIAQKIIDYTYQLKIGQEDSLTVSIGISLFPRDAKSYNALYRSADLALYRAKGNGKNGFSIYHKNENYELSAEERAIRQNGTPIQRVNIRNLEHVEKSLFDYSFGIINMMDDFYEAVSLIFKEIGLFFHIDEISLMEYNYNKRKARLLAGWSVEQVNENKDQNLELAELYSKYWDVIENRYVNHTSYMCQLKGQAKEKIYQEDFFKSHPVNSMIQFPIFDGTQLVGVVTFNDIKMEREWSRIEFTTLSSITKMLSSYMIKMLAKTELEDELFYNGYVADSQKLTYYSVDKDTYEILYASRYAGEMFPNIRIGEKCYIAVMGRGEPCENCPVMELTEDKKSYVTEVYHEKYDTWYTASASELYHKGRKEYLLCWTDVTNFIERVKARDRLTGIFSYDKFRMEVLKRIVNRSIQYAVICIGINDFVNINENYGYETGDEVLRRLADQFEDSLDEDEISCRIKGDDFLVLLKSGCCEELKERLSHILNSVKYLLTERYEDIQFKCNCGIYYIKKSDHSVSRILDKANQARKVSMNLYSEEHSFFLYSAEFELQIVEERKMEKNMLRALRDREFQIYLQPKVNLKDGSICGAEALVRWVRPNGDVLLPDRFIPLFERNRFVLEIDDYVYSSLLKQMKDWIQEKKNVPVISVNVSRLHLLDNGFPDHFCKLVDQYQIPHSLIELEVTESAFVENTQILVEMTIKLRKMGFVISMDDFGTGYSSLNFVKMLPIDILKIDGSFFKGNHLDERNKAVISSVLQLAKNMDLKIVSEGIETEEQVDYIMGEECDIAQGFFYYKPMKMEEFGKIIESKQGADGK